jgi:hypothetical protein
MSIVRAIENGSYHEVLSYLEAALRFGPRAPIEEDFLPAAAYARRFLTDLRTRLAADPGTADYLDGERGVRALMAILTQRTTLPGRPVQTTLDAASAARVRFIRALYLSKLQAVGVEDRLALQQAIETMSVVPLDATQWDDLKRLTRKRSVRVSDIADRLTAFHCGTSARRVRAALQHASESVVHA